MGINSKVPMAAGIGNNPIIQIGFVVRDAVKTAKQYAAVFGIGPWGFIDVTAGDFIFRGETMRNMNSRLRLALADLGNMQIELIQPLQGPSTHMSFLTEQGEGIHHVSFGAVEGHGQIISGLTGRGIGIEMQGLAGNVDIFTYMATQKELGTIIEFLNPAFFNPNIPSPFWGTLELNDDGVVNTKDKEIAQLGIVVENAEETAQNYRDLLGVGPWTIIDLKPEQFSDGTLYGANMSGNQCHLKIALADLGDIQIELIEPIKGASTHKDFLTTYGQGIHHLSFGECKDYDKIVSSLTDNGTDIEMSGVIGGATRFAYFSTQKALGTIFEVIDTNSEAQSAIEPFGRIES